MKILITPKIHPDLDGFACAVAYKKLLSIIDSDNEYVSGSFGNFSAEVRFLVDKFKIQTDYISFEENKKCDFDKFILVDASDLKGMPNVIEAEDVIEVIDHREGHKANELFPNAKIQVEKVGAAATQIVEKYIENNIMPDFNCAVLLYGAIFSNTLNFKADVVSERDRKAAHYLKLLLNVDENLIDEMFAYKTEYLGDNLKQTVEEDFKSFDFENLNKKIGIAQLEGVGLGDLVGKKKNELEDILRSLQNKFKLDLVFLTAADIKNDKNVFMVLDEGGGKLLESILNIRVEENIGIRNGLILRKEIAAILKKW